MSVVAIMARRLHIMWNHGAGAEVMQHVAVPMIGNHCCGGAIASHLRSAEDFAVGRAIAPPVIGIHQRGVSNRANVEQRLRVIYDMIFEGRSRKNSKPS